MRFNGDHFARLYRYDEAGLEQVTVNNHCIICDAEKLGKTAADLEQISTALCFTMNFFSQRGHVSQPQFYICEGKHALTPKRKHVSPRSVLPPSLGISFEMKESASSEAFEQVLTACLSGLAKDKALQITFERFLLALSRPERESQVVDLAICLESLLPFENEISFRFALYGALFSEKEADKKKEIYKTLKDLYATRSKIVHGSGDAQKYLTKLDDRWDALFDVAKFSILYKLTFLSTNTLAEWKDHLDAVALGAI